MAWNEMKCMVITSAKEKTNQTHILKEKAAQILSKLKWDETIHLIDVRIYVFSVVVLLIGGAHAMRKKQTQMLLD